MIKFKVEKVMDKKEVEKIVNSEMSKSGKMKEMFRGGLDVKEISKIMECRYNFVYNVISNEILKGNILESDLIRDKKVSKKDDIIKMLEEGKNIKEICVELKCVYNMVWKIKREWIESKEK